MNANDDQPFPIRVAELPHQSGGFIELMLGVSLAAVLPPAALMAQNNRRLPIIHADPSPTLTADVLSPLVGRAVTTVGSGQVHLGEVDRRLGALTAQVLVLRITDVPEALVTIGLVSARPTPKFGYRATPRELWHFSREILASQQVACPPVKGIGDDAFMTVRGGCTAQLAWLTDERLATVSVTQDGQALPWAIASTRLIAELVAPAFAAHVDSRSLLTPALTA